MRIIKKYSEIVNLPADIEAYLKKEFEMLHEYFGKGSVSDYDLGDIGEFAVIENSAELMDLSALGYEDGIMEQAIEFVEKFRGKTGKFFDLYILRDTDSGTRFLVESGILDNRLKDFMEKRIKR